ncbi:MAG: response regulator [Deltaproteobacteria bacterium]|nr:response regulator [Deltaproteobacteria bacterium]MBW2086709.1 response regulator [Deltaproteobacteria bacterium]
MKQRNESETDSPHIIVVDDDEAIRKLIYQTIKGIGYECSAASSGEEALKILEKNSADVIITDVKMPGLDGIELMRRVKEESDSDVIVMTGFVEDLTYEKAVESGASDFVQKPVTPRELLVRLKRVLRERALLAERNQAAEELQESFEKLQKTLEQTVHALTSTVEIKDPYTSGHQRRVTQLACAMADQMDLPAEQIDGIRIAGLLHDIGKISVPFEILNKPGRLSEAEFSLIKNHSQVSYNILKGIDFPWEVAPIVLQHHERMDGSGYPQGLPGKEILLEARILAVADVVEAMASHRPYRPALGEDKALEEISEKKGFLYDPVVADTCLTLFKEQRFGWQAGL